MKTGEAKSIFRLTEPQGLNLLIQAKEAQLSALQDELDSLLLVNPINWSDLQRAETEWKQDKQRQ